MSSAVQIETAPAQPGVPRAEIPPFELTHPPVAAPSRSQFVIAELLRHFGGRVARVEKPERWYVPTEPEDVAPHNAEPDWAQYGFRGQVGKLLWARGLRKKAIRFVSCNKCARPGVCSRYPEDHKFFIPNGCEVVFCRECADEVRRELFVAYRAVILAVILRGIPSGWYLARVSFTLRSDGSEIAPEHVKKFNACLRSVMRQTVGSSTGFGLLFVDEVGFEKRGHLPDAMRIAHGLNLHCHGIYFGPRLDWYRTHDLWMTVTEKAFGKPSRGFYVTPIRMLAHNPERAVSWALNHMLKYVSKPPAVTPERLASLIAAFDGARRVHSLGLFYGKKPEREKRDCPCPKCKALGILGVVGFEGRVLVNGGCIPRVVPIQNLLARGYVPLREAGRSAILSMGLAREESWGASP